MTREKGITVSEKHGLNPSMMQCYFCGETKGVALLGRLPGDAEAPQSAVFDKEPCDKCKAHMKEGIICIEVKDDDAEYRLGGFAVIKDRFFEENCNDAKMLEDILKKRVCFMATTIFR